MMRTFLSLCGALLSLSLVNICCSDKTTAPTFPRTPSNPSPASGDSIFTTNLYLSWESSHPEGRVVSFDIYVDTVSPPIIYRIHNRADSLFVAELQCGLTYFWKVVAVDESYNTASGPIWSFVVGPQRGFPPDPPKSPRPADGDTNVSIDANLSWVCIDSGGERLAFDIYFGTDSLPPIVAEHRYGTQYDPGTLLEETTYFWKIEAEDFSGYRSEGPVWHFTTGMAVNLPPSVPSDPSPTDSEIEFPPYYGEIRWSCSDPENDLLTYGLFIGTTNPPPFKQNLTSNSYDPPSGENFQLGATYYWKIRATDAVGNVTEGPIWSFSTWPANITPQGSLEIGPTCFDIGLYGNYAFLGCHNDGLLVVDISNPASPLYLTRYRYGDDFSYVTVDGNYVYASGTRGIEILDVTNPLSPQAVGLLDSVWGQISISGNIACVARNQQGISIVDVSDRAHPAILGGISTDYAYGVDIDGSYAYVADGYTGLKVIDISNPSNPILVGSVDTGTLMSVAVSGIYAYVADDYSGMQMINISDPRHPQLFRTVSIAGGTHKVTLSVNYAYFETSHGHIVVDITNPGDIHLAGTIRESDYYNPAFCIVGAGSLIYISYGARNDRPEFRILRLEH